MMSLPMALYPNSFYLLQEGRDIKFDYVRKIIIIIKKNKFGKNLKVCHTPMMERLRT